MNKLVQRPNQLLIDIYRTIMIYCAVCHGVFAIGFGIVDVSNLLYYNIASTIFYTALAVMAQKGYFRIAVTATHLEICFFVANTIISLGWQSNAQLTLFLAVAMCHFNPFAYKRVMYLISLLEIGLYFAMWEYANHFEPLFPIEDPVYMRYTQFGIALGCFFLLLRFSVLYDLLARSGFQGLIQKNMSLSEQATHDQMTGLFNRRAFEPELRSMDGKVNYVVAMCDIDNFKSVNDTYGHAMGDRVIRALASQLMMCCGRTAKICRWGGEEFLLLFRPGITPVQARADLDLVRRRFSEEVFTLRSKSLSATITVGYALGDECNTVEKVIEAADNRLYIGKNTGKNCVTGPEDEEERYELLSEADKQKISKSKVKK